MKLTMQMNSTQLVNQSKLISQINMHIRYNSSHGDAID